MYFYIHLVGPTVCHAQKEASETSERVHNFRYISFAQHQFLNPSTYVRWPVFLSVCVMSAGNILWNAKVKRSFSNLAETLEVVAHTDHIRNGRNR